MQGLFLTGRAGLFDAMRYAAGVYGELDLRRAERVEELRGFNGPVLLDLCAAKRVRGVVDGFYLLRPLLMGNGETRTGAIALLGIEAALFADGATRIPARERVRYFPVPFSLDELFGFLCSTERPAARPVTRRLLRGRLAPEDIARIAGGDRHPTRHFSPMADGVENAFWSGRRDAFVRGGATEMSGLWFRNDLLAASAMFASIQEHPACVDRNGECAGLLESLTGILEWFKPLAHYIDRETAGGAVPEPLWDAFKEELRGLKAQDARRYSVEWIGSWQRLCQEIVRA